MCAKLKGHGNINRNPAEYVVFWGGEFPLGIEYVECLMVGCWGMIVSSYITFPARCNLSLPCPRTPLFLLLFVRSSPIP